MTFGERIDCIQKARGLTQRELAAQMSIQPEAIQRYKSSARVPKPETVVSFAKALQVSSFVLEEGNTKYICNLTEGDLIALGIFWVKSGIFEISIRDNNILMFQFSSPYKPFIHYISDATKMDKAIGKVFGKNDVFWWDDKTTGFSFSKDRPAVNTAILSWHIAWLQFLDASEEKKKEAKEHMDKLEISLICMHNTALN